MDNHARRVVFPGENWSIRINGLWGWGWMDGWTTPRMLDRRPVAGIDGPRALEGHDVFAGSGDPQTAGFGRGAF